MGLLRLSWILTLRDWRAGELRLLLVALVVAVAALSSVGFFVDRMKQALSLEARQLLGADLVLASDGPLDDALMREVRAAGARVASTVTFPSMAIVGDRAQLASVKAVSDGYPLRGALRGAEAPNVPDRAVQGGPARGRAWADPQLAQALGLSVGEHLQLGEVDLVLDKIITYEPDRGANFVNFAPRLMIALDDLAATALVQPASRVTYRMLAAGDATGIARVEARLRAGLARGQRLETLESGRPELRVTLERAEKFLALVALLTAVIAAVAIALATRRFAERHLDGCAVMRAIGVPQARLSAVLVLELAWVGIAGGIAGCLIGWTIHWGLVGAIANVIDLPLPLPGMAPAIQAIAAGGVLLLGFGAWPFLRLAGVPPLRVLRRELGSAPAGAIGSLLVAVGAFAVLLFWLADDRRLALIALGGFGAGILLLVGVSLGLLQALGPLRAMLAASARSPALRLALASWTRRRGTTIAQTSALSIGLMALLLLTVTRTDLLDTWRKASPPDAPNRFVINIQPDQVEAVRSALGGLGIERAELYPMIRGRLIAINGRDIGPEAYQDERARRLVDREFNLSYSERQPGHNRTISGRWLDPEADEVSVEQGIASTLGLKVGDELAFDVAGVRRVARVCGLRKLAWDSMKVNFFMITSPRVLAGQPQTLITAFHQPGAGPGRKADSELVRAFPNLTVFDMGNIVRQVQTMLDQVVRAIEFLFLLTLAAGAVVLYAALASSRDERTRDAALMRALGASRVQLVRAQIWELGLAGALAGLLAAAGALSIGLVLASQVFQFEYSPRWAGLLGGVLAGIVVAVGAGLVGLRGVLNAPPLTTLRNV
jgi:putative ABC transport system permease protein